MNNDIKIGSTVQLLYLKDKKVRDFVITDIFFEKYISGFKTIVKAKYYSQKCECWFEETYYINDFFDALRKAKEYTDNKEAENDNPGS